MDHPYYALTGDGWEIHWWPRVLHDRWNFLMTATPDFRAVVPPEMVRAFERQREAEPHVALLRLATWRTVSLDTDGRAEIEFEAATGERFAWTGAFERRNVDLEYRVDPYARRPPLPDEPRVRGGGPHPSTRYGLDD